MWQLRAKCSSHSGATEECASHKFTWSVTMSKQPDCTHAGSWWTFCCCCCCSYNAVGSGRLYIHELNRKSRQPRADNIDLEGERGKIWLAIQPPSKETNVMAKLAKCWLFKCGQSCMAAIFEHHCRHVPVANDCIRTSLIGIIGSIQH